MALSTAIIKRTLPDVIGKLCRKFNLQEWTGDVVYEDRMSGDTCAGIHIDEDYLDYTITVSSEKIRKYMNEPDAKTIFMDWMVHELMHIIVDPIYFMAVNSVTNMTGPFLESKREQAVQRLTNIMLKDIDVEEVWG